MRKQGIIAITPEQLHACLQLPDDITLEHIFEDAPQAALHSANKVYIILSGESLPVPDVPEEGRIPQIYGEYVLQTSSEGGEKKTHWRFRLADTR